MSYNRRHEYVFDRRNGAKCKPSVVFLQVIESVVIEDPDANFHEKYVESYTESIRHSNKGPPSLKQSVRSQRSSQKSKQVSFV